MVLTDRQRSDLHAGIHEYLLAQEGDDFAQAAAALARADPDACSSSKSNPSTNNLTTPLLEKKWTAIPRLQKKVLELERAVAQNVKIHAHRPASADSGGRRMLPRLPATHTLQGHSAPVSTVEVHPVFTVVVSGSEDGTIKVWDHESGDYVRTLKGHTNTVTSLSFSPTGSHLASASTDLSIKLWDVDTYACVRTLRGHDHTISAVRFLPLAASSTSDNHNVVATNNTATGESTAAAGLDAETAGSQHVLTASRDQTVKVWDVETGFCDLTLSDHGDWVRCIAVRADGELFCTAGNDTTIWVYDHERNKVCCLRGHEHVVESVAFLCETTTKKTSVSKQVEAARDWVASAGRDRTVRLWSVSAVSCLFSFEAHDNWVRSVLMHPSGNYLISAGDDRTIRVMDIQAKRCLRTLEAAHPHFITSLGMHPTLPILVSGSVDTTLRCWMLD